MARLARIVIPGVAYHVTQRGNRRLRTFFQPSDYQEYLSLMKEWCQTSGVAIWPYCLMPNHISEMELHMQTGRPLGTSSFIRTLEQKTGRVLRIMKPGVLEK